MFFGLKRNTLVVTLVFLYIDLMYGGPDQYNGTDRNLSITFNINHGVQIMRPPPYSTRYMSTEKSSSELRVIGTNAHRVDSYFLNLTMHT